MASLLIRNIHTLTTMVEGEKPLHGVDLLIRDGKIAAIGAGLKPEPQPDRIIDGSRCVAYPGFVNTHHHLYQTLTRNLPKVQNAKLFDWLVGLYEVWRELDPEAVEVSTRVGLGELLLSGCTTTTDHFYVFPKSAPAEFLDVEIDTAREMGVRFHPTRGSMSRGRSGGGLPPDDVVQDPDVILKDCERLIAKYHDPEPFSMCRIVLAPCSPFSVTTELLAETAVFAREKKVFLHTHLCETMDEEDFCLQTVGQRPLDYMEKVGWVGPDVWVRPRHLLQRRGDQAPGRHQDRRGPLSRLEPAAGLRHLQGAPAHGRGRPRGPRRRRQRQQRLLQLPAGDAAGPAGAPRGHRRGTPCRPRRSSSSPPWAAPAILGQPEIGQLKVGSAADLAMFRLDRIDFAGAMADPASAPLFCGAAPRAEYTVVAGRVLVEKGQLVGVDEEALFERANRVAERMLSSAEGKLQVSYR